MIAPPADNWPMSKLDSYGGNACNWLYMVCVFVRLMKFPREEIKVITTKKYMSALEKGSASSLDTSRVSCRNTIVQPVSKPLHNEVKTRNRLRVNLMFSFLLIAP